MTNLIIRLGMSVLAASALLLSGCGGGGGGGNGGTPVSGAAPTYTSISGLVAYGSGAAGAEVELHDLEGQLGRTITDAKGGFMLPLSTITRPLSPPFVIRAKFQIGSTQFNLFSISQGESGGDLRMNVTPITDVITRVYVAPDGNDPTAVELGDPIPNNPTRLSRLRQNLREMLGSKLPADVTDFVSENFKPIPTQFEMDALLERVKVELDSTGVKLKTALGRQLAQRTLAQMRSDQSQSDDASTITDTEAGEADADRGTLPVGEQIATNLLPVAFENEVVVDVDGSVNLVLQGRNATSFAISRQPAHGTLGVVNASSGLYIYTPAPGWTGTDEFLFTVSNAYGTSTAVRVRLVVSDGCTSNTSGTTPVTYTRQCDKPLAGAPLIVTPAAGYPFSTAPEPLLVSGDAPVLRTYWERSAETTNINSVSGIDLSRRTASYDATADRYVVTTSSGFYNRGTGARIAVYTEPYTRSRATYARHASGTGYVLSGYAVARFSYESPYTGFEPYEFGSLIQYTLQGYDANGRPLYAGTETVCVPDVVMTPFTLFAETLETWSPSGAIVTTMKRENNCSISIDQLGSIAYETRPADLRHSWN